MPNQDPTQNPQVPTPTVVTNPASTDVPTTMPPHTDLPPMPDFMSVDNAPTPVTTSSTNSSPPPASNNDTGSASPPDLPPMITTPKKKFGSGKIIATILGILLLVGGVGTGVYLTQQQQQLNSEAAKVVKAEKTAVEKKAIAVQKNQETMAAGGKSGLSTQQISNYTNDVNVYNNNHPDTTVALTLTTASITTSTDQGTCQNINGAQWCEGNDAINGKHYGVCAGNTGCNAAVSAAGYTVVIAAVQCIKDSNGSCTSNDTSSTKATTDAKCKNNCNYFGNEAYICAQGVNASNGCGANNGTKIGSVPKCFCGTIQVDTGSGFVSYSSQCGCGGNNNTTPSAPAAPPVVPTAPLVVPTAPPTTSDSAVCQNVKAYSSTWVALTSAQLSALAPTTVVNFCVVGSATAGVFDKAQFTINGIAQAETTIQRPSTQDYCQNYTIPAGVSAFNVTAKIHHATLGWK